MVMVGKLIDFFLRQFALKAGSSLTDLHQRICRSAECAQHHDLLFRTSMDKFGHIVHTLRFSHRSASEFHYFHLPGFLGTQRYRLMNYQRKKTEKAVSFQIFFKTGTPWRLYTVRAFQINYFFTFYFSPYFFISFSL